MKIFFLKPRFSSLLAGALALVLTACGGGGGGGSSGSGSGGTPTPTPTPTNVVSLVVNGGITGNEVNRAFVSVTVCQSGSTANCKTIDNVVVDTGSMGLRLLSSVMPTAFTLPRQATTAGLPLLNCVQFVDNTYAFGSIATADISLGSKTAANVPIQVIADPTYASLGKACGSGSALSSATVLGANGILGVGLAMQDCGSACATKTSNGAYYTCTSSSCTAVTGVAVPVSQQLKNPVAVFTSDNNGVVIDFPAVANAGAASVTGSLIFGIGTQTNNQITGGTTLLTDTHGYITTAYDGQTLKTSYIDSGSNGLYFPSSKIPLCTQSGFTDFFCPTSLTNGSATLTGFSGNSTPATFAVDNTVNMIVTAKSVYPALAGPSGDSTTFDWGLPFFYGRRVAIGIEGQVSNIGTGPFFAY